MLTLTSRLGGGGTSEGLETTVTTIWWSKVVQTKPFHISYSRLSFSRCIVFPLKIFSTVYFLNGTQTEAKAKALFLSVQLDFPSTVLPSSPLT